MSGHGWPWLAMAGRGCKRVAIAGHAMSCRGQPFPARAGHGQPWLVLAGHGWPMACLLAGVDLILACHAQPMANHGELDGLPWRATNLLFPNHAWPLAGHARPRLAMASLWLAIAGHGWPWLAMA